MPRETSEFTRREKLVLRLAYVLIILGWIAGLGCFVIEPEAVTAICFTLNSVIAFYVLGRAV